jgi:LysR family transcriptional regulator for bpeEF and oprC
MNSLHGISVFLKVVETRSFSEAGRALGVTTSAVSAAVQRLEQKLGVRLLNRTTRRVFPTAEGLEFYGRCKQIVADLEQAEVSAGSSKIPSGNLRVGAPLGLGRIWLVPRLGEFINSYPAVSLEVALGDTFPASSRELFDCLIHVGEIRPSRMIVRKLASVNYVVCASPQYLRERGWPQTPEDLKDHACLSYRRPRNGLIRHWRFRRGRSIQTFTPPNGLILGSGVALIAAAKAGLGLAQVAEYYTSPEIESGALVEVMKRFKAPAYDISIVFQQRRNMTQRLRVFVDYIADVLGRQPWRTEKGE